MKKQIQRHQPVDFSDPAMLFANRKSIEDSLYAKIREADSSKGKSEKARYEFSEWLLRLNAANQLLENHPDNENLRFLVEQAGINLDLATKKVEALDEQERLAEQTKLAAQESLKKLQRLEVLQASGHAVRGNRNELLEIMTRTAQLELSDGSNGDRETRHAEYYAQALLELTMEGH
jgi:hypothetical protein